MSILHADIAKLLDQHKELEKILRVLDLGQQEVISNRISAKGFYVDFDDGKPRQPDFIQALSDNIPRYCLQRTERERNSQLMKSAAEADDFEKVRNISNSEKDKAKRLFIEAAEKRNKKIIELERKGSDISNFNKDGEAAELLLYLILEKYLKAPQIVSKMALKTNSSMPVHGADAIHMNVDESSNVLNIFWGEAKLYKSVEAAIRSAIESTAEIINDHDHKSRDIEILCEFPDLHNESEYVKEELIKVFDPYDDSSMKKKEYVACFIGFNFEDYEELLKLPAEEVQEKFIDSYLNTVRALKDNINSNIDNKKLSSINFIFIFLPFECTNEFRKAFRKKLGWHHD